MKCIYHQEMKQNKKQGSHKIAHNQIVTNIPGSLSRGRHYANSFPAVSHLIVIIA